MENGSLQIQLKGIFYFAFGRKKNETLESFFYDF
jgi:hypothetical protein